MEPHENAGEGGRPSFPVLIQKADRQGLVALVEEHLKALDPVAALAALRHPFASKAVIEAIASSRKLMSVRSVRKAIALHPLSPRHVAFLCLLDLTWRDLLDVGRETRVTMPVRRLANEKLREKLEKLAIGEKISLARLADRSLHTRLLEESGTAVLSALLRNTRLLAEDLLTWMAIGNPEPVQLALLGQDKEWTRRVEVREALLKHPSTPRAIALALLPRASRAEWRSLSQDPRVHPLLAACASDLLEAPPRFRKVVPAGE